MGPHDKWTTGFGNDAVASGCAALNRGAPFVVDVKMIRVDLNAARLDQFRCAVHDEIVRLHCEEGITPGLVLGMPVGFVNAAESNELLVTTGIPYVVARGRKGGSTITVAALHAFLNVAAGDLRCRGRRHRRRRGPAHAGSTGTRSRRSRSS